MKEYEKWGTRSVSYAGGNYVPWEPPIATLSECAVARSWGKQERKRITSN